VSDTFKTAVIRCRAEHPDWHAGMIAEHVGCTPKYVRALNRELALSIAPHPIRYSKRAQICVALEKSELDLIRQAAAAAGMKIAPYIRRCVMRAA
jgi:sirohydrochlorin ferrochelatase